MLTYQSLDHVIGSPLALASHSYAEKAWVYYKNIPVLQRPNVRFVHGTVSKIDTESKTATIVEQPNHEEQTEAYDFFVAATGLRRVWPVVPQSAKREDYLKEAGRHIDAVINSTAPVLVVGGGQSCPVPLTNSNAPISIVDSMDPC